MGSYKPGILLKINNEEAKLKQLIRKHSTEQNIRHSAHHFSLHPIGMKAGRIQMSKVTRQPQALNGER